MSRNSNGKQDTRMGDAFMQQRRGNHSNLGRGGSNDGRAPSFVEIQAEQHQHQHDLRPRSSNTNKNGRGGGSGRRNNDYRDMPIEQGCICSLKDAFGFIYCADRQEELFFHFTEVQNCHPADLEIDDEVEFRVGTARQEDKMRAFSLHRLERGTVVWEMEEDPGHRSQGIVEKPPRLDRSGKVLSEGVIRLLVEDEPTEEADQKEEGAASALAATGPMVRFTPNDFQPAEPSQDAGKERSFRRNSSALSNSSRGGGGWLLGVNDLVEFTLVTSRRNQTKYARSIHLLQSDRERQRILKEEKLLENAVLERGVVTSLKNDFGFLRSNKRREEIYFHYTHIDLDESEEEEQELKIGQEVEFLVVTEIGGSPKETKLSARRVKFLPTGSVHFETIIARGVAGIVTRCPHPSDPGHMRGTVRVVDGIADVDDNGNERTVEEISLDAKDAPGGTFSLREGAVGLWIREGDTLLFDVAKESVDGSFAVHPTKRQVGLDEDDETARVKLVSCALAARTEGVVSVLKDSFGFVHCAERPIDSYFRLYEVFPKELHRDLLRGRGIKNVDLVLQPGSEVQFDLSVQRTAGGTSSRQTRKGGGLQETVKAQRVLMLPPNSIMQIKVIATNVKGVVEKEDSKQSYAGTIELEEEITGMTLEERHPLVGALVKSMLENKDGSKSSIVFPDVQSMKEDEVVMEVVDALSGGTLQCSHLPVPGQARGRLCISWTTDDSRTMVDESGSESNDAVDATNKGSESGDGTAQGSRESSSMKNNRKKKRKSKMVKSFRYDKHNLVKELLNEIPPSTGDQVVCDVIQPRRTGTIQLANVRIVERQDPTATTTTGEVNVQPMETGIGIISEVVNARQFGFVSLLDEGAAKRELLFFHFRHVISNTAHDNECKAKNLKAGIQKGDEARFCVSVQKKGGKRTAVNVEIVPRGTLDIPNKAAKNACHGLVLMEPSHSSLKDTPDRKAKSRQTSLSPVRAGVSPQSGLGRFGNVDLNDGGVRNNMKKEEGCILLTIDPTNMFGVPSTIGTDSDDLSVAFNQNKTSKDASNSALCTHIPYRQGGIAIHGVGSTSIADAAAYGPRRGDLVSFIKAKSGSMGARDVRVVTTGCAKLVRGRLEQISVDDKNTALGTALFIAATEKEETYWIQLKEVISCDLAVLKDKEPVEGLLHEGKIFGVCRTKDLFLESKLGVSHKERPKLNLTVRKGLGGKIMAQSMMAKGPDGTNGFDAGWTTRVSKHN